MYYTSMRCSTQHKHTRTHIDVVIVDRVAGAAVAAVLVKMFCVGRFCCRTKKRNVGCYQFIEAHEVPLQHW